MATLSIQITINDTANDGFATQKLSRQLGSDSGAILSRIAAANRGIHGNQSDDDIAVILKSLVAAVAAAES